nr:unnamed protein product [Haemonchus contortus]
MEDHNDEEVRVPEAEEDLFQMRREDLEDMLAQAREAGIASVHQPPPVSTGLGTSVKPTFKKTGLARQYEFNGGLIDILAPIADASQEGEVRDTLHQALTLLQQRNELLVIADSDPEVFEFYDQHSKAESLRSTNPILAAFLREKKKKEVKKPTAPRSVVWSPRKEQLRVCDSEFLSRAPRPL